MGAVALALIGGWLIVQTIAGRLPGRLLSYRGGNLGNVPTAASSSSSGGAIATMPATIKNPGMSLGTATGATQAHGLIWPIHGTVTQEFGHNGHPGIDIAAQTGTPIAAAAAGTVSFAGYNDGYGQLVVIRHSPLLSTAYAHQSKIDVQVGQDVAAGETIGEVGSTGNSTGSHLHFEVRIGGVKQNPRAYVGGAP